MVVLKCGTMKIPVEVNVDDNVGELRKELAKIQQRFELNKPHQEGYFFIYKQNVMDDDRSFQWHRVDHGDTIEVDRVDQWKCFRWLFNGSDVIFFFFLV